ncbi:hypothetical protein LEP1GSC013_1995 [Leptospira interrogans serovar Valbuzzi str. Duyster]|nr:hypothetical protein LEP1GSC013_1995 [Leptospira interrogans serovar Valbuzzi str. Duyster]ENO71697.1 hypothetical protein LEP1GSC012_3539 [Leptospira interrogans serovar Valbuzzi str. Valbuzzi]
MVKLNHSQIFVNPFRSKEFEKCVKKREFKRLYLKKRNVQSESLVFIQNNNLVSNLWT